MTVTVGIDPGATGAIAILIDGELIEAFDMPTANGIVAASLLRVELATVSPDHIWIEQVASMPGQGISSTWKFGRSYGIAEGVASQWPLFHVTPGEWKRTFRLTGKEKDAARLAAIDRWPDHAALFKRKKDCGRADAAFIALHGWQRR